MESSNQGVNRAFTAVGYYLINDIEDTPVGTAGENHQTLLASDNQGEFIDEVILEAFTFRSGKKKRIARRLTPESRCRR